ncbi:MAG: hypothetical protein J6A36_03165 [Clostridia bacterium]|nr:hypothetical protein [Clostridia bacterium]
MDSENKDLEIVMGDDIELNISEVGDIMNNLKPNTSEKKKNIIIPVAMKKPEDKQTAEDFEDDEELTEYGEDIEDMQDENEEK